MAPETWGLLTAVFFASLVEFVEAFTIVLAIGFSRGWRSAFAGTLAALAALAVVTFAAGYTLGTWLPESVLQLAIGSLVLIFGMQWLRKAVLRAGGALAHRDEDAVFAGQSRAAASKTVSGARFGLDPFGFVVAFKGVFLEGIEVVFIVITFGLASSGGVGTAAVAAGSALLLVLIVGVALKRPLSAIPENTLKYLVGLLLTTFGSYWALAGLGAFQPGGASLDWPGGDWAILALLAAWLLASAGLVAAMRRRSTPAPAQNTPGTGGAA